MKNVVLIGMRGSGKTIVSRLLSKRLNREYLELDDLMVERVGMKISDIVKKYGWGYFRENESKIVHDVSKFHNKVISAGGGVVTRGENIENLKKNGFIIWLRTKPLTLLKRVGNDPNRPPLTNKKTLKEEIEELLRQREGLYKSAADCVIDTDKLDENEVVERVLETLKGANV